MCSKKGKDYPIGRKGDGHRFLGFTRCDLHRLPGEGPNGHRALLCQIIGPVQRRITKKKVLFHHDNAPAHTSVVATANWSNYTTNCCPIHYIWPRATFFLFPNLKKSLAEQKFELSAEVENVLHDTKSLLRYWHHRAMRLSTYRTVLVYIYMYCIWFLAHPLQNFSLLIISQKDQQNLMITVGKF